MPKPNEQAGAQPAGQTELAQVMDASRLHTEEDPMNKPVNLKTEEVLATEQDGSEKKPEFKHCLSFFYALIASIFFGIADYLIALMSIKNGIKWVYPTFIITFFVWGVYHIGKWIKLNKTRKLEGKEAIPFWDKASSVYYMPIEEGEPLNTKSTAEAKNASAGPIDGQKFKLNWGSIWVSIRRFIINFMIYVMLGLTFIFADKSGIHTGVVTSLFCSSLIFTVVYFYFKYGQKLSRWDVIGIIMVCICIALISLSEGEHSEGETDGVITQALDQGDMVQEEGFNVDKFLTIIFALGTGITFSTNSIEMHYSGKT